MESSMRVIPSNSVSTHNFDTMSAVVKLAEEINDIFLQQCAESNALLSLSSHAEWSMNVIPSNSVSTHNADTLSAVVKLAEKIDDIFL